MQYLANISQSETLNKMPRVSVIVPNYNHGRFLEKRMNSILSQTFQDYEIIFLDDASTDNSIEICQKYSSLKNFRFNINKVNSGCTFKQWNKGVRIAKGEYIWIAESDDYADRKFLEKLVAKLDENQQLGLAYCQSWIVDQDDKMIGSEKINTNWIDRERWTRDYTNNGVNECSRYLLQQNTIPNASAVVFRKWVFLDCGGADESLKLTGDWYTWVNILLNSDITFLAEHLNYFRHHEDSVRTSSEKIGLGLEERYRMLQYMVKSLNISEKTIEIRCDMLMKQWIKALIRNKISMKRNRNIYHTAVSFDRKLHWRLFRILAIKTMNIPKAIRQYIINHF